MTKRITITVKQRTSKILSLHKVRHLKKRAFLLAFAQTGSVTEAAAKVEIDRTTHYNWITDPEYAADFAEAQERAARELEDEAVKRAKAGSDTLLIFLLKCRNRKVFGDKYEHTGKDGTPLLSMADIDRIIQGTGPDEKT